MYRYHFFPFLFPDELNYADAVAQCPKMNSAAKLVTPDTVEKNEKLLAFRNSIYGPSSYTMLNIIINAEKVSFYVGNKRKVHLNSRSSDYVSIT